MSGRSSDEVMKLYAELVQSPSFDSGYKNTNLHAHIESNACLSTSGVIPIKEGFFLNEYCLKNSFCCETAKLKDGYCTPFKLYGTSKNLTGGTKWNLTSGTNSTLKKAFLFKEIEKENESLRVVPGLEVCEELREQENNIIDKGLDCNNQDELSTFSDGTASKKNSVDPLCFPSLLRATTQQQFSCWLCETSCAYYGWLNAPEIYIGMSDTGHAAASCQHVVTLLTLCTRCSAACSLPLDAPSELVLRKAGATRALARHSEQFVTFVRKYKKKLESIAVDLVEASTFSGEGVNIAGGVWRFFGDVQRDVIYQLVKELRCALEMPDTTTQHFCEKQNVMNFCEVAVLEEELSWLENQLVQIDHRRKIDKGIIVNSDFFNTAATGSGKKTGFTNTNTLPVARSNVVSFAMLTHNSEQSVRCNDIGVQDTGSQHVSGFFTTTNQKWGRNRGYSVYSDKWSHRALDRMMERVLTTRLHHSTAYKFPAADEKDVTVDYYKKDSNDGHPAGYHFAAEAIPKATATMVENGTFVLSGESENIFAQYFEGKLNDLPPFRRLFFNLVGGGELSERTDFGRLSDQSQQTDLQDLHDDFSADNGVKMASIELTVLLKELSAWQKRFEKADKALYACGKKIADLEKNADHMCGLILEQSLLFAHMFTGMERFLGAVTQTFVNFAMQKSLLFSDEMSALMRQVQREAYNGCI